MPIITTFNHNYPKQCKGLVCDDLSGESEPEKEEAGGGRGGGGGRRAPRGGGGAEGSAWVQLFLEAVVK